MKKKITAVLVGILIIGLVSAGIVPWISNIVTGTVSVEGPVFYLDGSVVPIPPNNPDLVYRNLVLNSPSEEEDETYLFDGHRLLFISSPLGIEDFYEAEFNMKVWIKTNNESNIIQYRVVRVRPSLSTETICEPDEAITFDSHYDSFWEKEASCTSSGTINLDTGDRIGLEITGAGGTSEYWISTGKEHTDGYSRMEVTAI